MTYFQVNFLINAAFEDAAFIRGRRLFHFPFSNAAFIRRRCLKEDRKYGSY